MVFFCTSIDQLHLQGIKSQKLIIDIHIFDFEDCKPVIPPMMYNIQILKQEHIKVVDEWK
jgi:hypothetical protein